MLHHRYIQYILRLTTYVVLGLSLVTPVLGLPGPAAAIAATDNVAWRMIVIPDTQKYAQFETNIGIFNYMTQWMVDNKDSLKIGLVLSEGDIVEHWFPDDEWLRMKAAYSTLNGQLPYVLIPGNHDTYNDAPRRPSRMNEFFLPADNPLNDPATGGILKGTMVPGQLDNAYYEFAAPDGRNLLITGLEWGPRNAAVDWANSIVSQSRYQNHTAILDTHAYLYFDGQRYDYATKGDTQLWSVYSLPTANDADGTNDGEELWQKLVRGNANYEMVFSGHVIGDQVDRLTSLNDAGGDVHQMVFNAQADPNGGDGWLRILEFLDDGRTVHVRTFSPWLESLGLPAERFTDDYNFFITLQQLGDLDRDGFVGITDLNIVLSHWNQNVSQDDPLVGDPSGDGFVGIDDLNLVLGNWNAGTPPSGSPVPEPGTVVLLAVGMVAMRRRVA